MSLTGALNSAISGLTAAQIGIEWASQNVSNANTPGYGRKVVQQESNSIGGVRITGVDRSVNDTLFRESLQELGDLAAFQVTNDYLDRITALLGDPTTGGRLGADLADLSEAVENLAISPNGTNARVLVVDRAEGVGNTLEDLSASVQETRVAIDEEIANAIEEINGALEDIAYLNGQIGHYSSVSQPIGDLQDNRDQALRTVAKHMPIRVVDRENGELTVYLPSGMTLVDGAARPFDSYGNLMTIGAETEYPSSFDTISFAASPGSDATPFIQGGRLGELIKLRDETLPQVQMQLDNLAVGMRDEINLVHNRGTALPPPQTLTATNAFDDANLRLSYKTGHDTQIVVLDANGDQVATAALSAFVTAGGAAMNNFTLADVHNQTVNGITLTVTNDVLSISFNSATHPTGVGIGVLDTGLGTGELDAAITVSDNGGVGPSYAASGFSNLFGFNDLLTTDGGGPTMMSNAYQLTDAISTSAVTVNVLTTSDNYQVVMPANSTLEDTRAALVTAGVNARLVRSGDGYALRIGPPDPLAVDVSSAGTVNLAFHSSEIGAGETFGVASDIASDPRGVAAGRLVSDGGAPASYSIGSNDVAIANALAATFQGTSTFPQSAGLPQMTTTFAGYNAQIVGDLTSKASNAERSFEIQELFVGQLESRLSQDSGVSIDGELSEMIKLQNAYSAAARIISTVDEMFDVLNSIVN